MPYRTRSTRRLAHQTKRRLLLTIIISLLLLYTTINWILPTIINSVGFLRGIFGKSEKTPAILEDSTLAPPVLTIPYEATNTGKIDIQGFATPRSKVKIFVDEDLKAEVEVESGGNFAAKNIELNLGTNSIYGKTVDEKSKESLLSKTIKLIYDNEKPSLEVSQPEDGKTYQGERRIKVLGKTEKEAQVFVNESQVIVNAEGNFSTEYSLNNGENIITIKAKDQASNITESLRRVTFTP